MFNSNLGNIDRIGRILLGAAMLILYTVIAPAPFSWLLLFGLVAMASGLLGTCPIYSRLNMSTNEAD
ncbi:YgaP family membrane protein [Antarcticimicrobium sediminis]|uniref:DUF2892 domain-containing protein n=1 Tax=Antarcticimicrobium sediminis TaxID=2546227 RepID=A0A4R5EZ20_9RHOB|nr:DUF2892 domain-containing protein [Antarcticimicrobium sediminis]MDX2483916.1 DUF2892 domain-containing protein [Pseudodonghicola sp.]TDE40365.1 DUF2892 domain-containing protein [Antarcticimicrobium sediminis]